MSSSIAFTAILSRTSGLVPLYPPVIDMASKFDGGKISFGICLYEKTAKTIRNVKNI